MSVYAGVDIGGTFTKVGANEKFVSFDTPKNRSELINKIVEVIRELCPDVRGVGIACPGAVKDGRAEFIPNLAIAPFDGKEISSVLKVPVRVVNDGDAAAFGESLSLNKSDVVMLTLGTGVGGGIIIGGKLYEGSGCAGEIGHMVICAGGRKCSCGMNGCLEAYASASALLASADGKFSSAKEVFDAADMGDQLAVGAVEEYIFYLSLGVVNLCNIFRPQVIIIGGGIGSRADLPDRIVKNCERLNYGYKFAPKPLIIRARLGDNAGVVGAAELIKNEIEEKK